MKWLSEELYADFCHSVEYDWEARAKRRPNPEMNLEIAEENLVIMKDVFDEIGVKHWLCFGTLLGAVRDGSFIPHDIDIDIGLSINAPRERPRLVSALRTLNASGFALIRDFGPHITVMRKDEYIDLYDIQWRLKKWRRIWFCMGWEFPYEHFACFTTINFLGRKFLIPAKIEEHLIQVYGLDWRIPRKKFHPEDPKPIDWLYLTKHWPWDPPPVERSQIARLRQGFRLRTRLKQIIGLT